jgi:hypothetical protein
MNTEAHTTLTAAETAAMHFLQPGPAGDSKKKSITAISTFFFYFCRLLQVNKLS